MGIFSCDDSTDEAIFRKQLNVEFVEIPDEAIVNEPIEIHATAYAAGCWSSLEIELRKISSTKFLIEASGVLNKDLICPAVIWTEDTTFLFTPTELGEYYFQINQEPLNILRDTLTVN